jgi:late competence protein required for DNA uptake (superfamily II DNA/RNA helicase)
MWGESRQERDHRYVKREKSRCKICNRTIRGRHHENYIGMLTCHECMALMGYSKAKRRIRQWLTISA